MTYNFKIIHEPRLDYYSYKNQGNEEENESYRLYVELPDRWDGTLGWSCIGHSKSIDVLKKYAERWFKIKESDVDFTI